MISILITAFNEPGIIKTLESITVQQIHNCEILVATPDNKTENLVKKFARKNGKNIKIVKDPGEGKPTALNLLFKEAEGDILVLTDGDVVLNKNSIKELLKQFSDKKVGVVSGRPVSTNSRNCFFDYVSHLLTDLGAHQTRLEKSHKGKFLACSGYLMALRSGIVSRIPGMSLADDAVISHLVYEAGYKTRYAQDAIVYVKYPSNLRDWIKQKRRSTSGYVQLKKFVKGKEQMRNFWLESAGLVRIFTYPQNFKEFVWTILLVFLRLYLWSIVFYEMKVRKSGMEIWQRVESTKV